ncbi:MAG: efflux RND transporter periplasmic adaptor subunit [Spirochaetaceae bacterium]|nr:efflux RND transporter periplasmic adaptor subunit [Spirochaetaceae bacterium]
MDTTKKFDLIGKIIVIILIALFVAIGIITITKDKNANPMQGPAGYMGNSGPATITVSVKPIEPELIQKTVLLNGNVSSKVETSIYPDTSGKITKILKNVGDSVINKEIIAYIDPSKPGSTYAASPIKATVSGTIINLPYHIGDTVSSSTALATIGSLDDLEITLNVSEKYSSYLKNGLNAYVSFLSAPGEIFTAKVTSVNPVVNALSRTQKVTLELDKKDVRVKPGMFAQVRLVIQEKKDVIVIPQTAVKLYNDEKTVFIVTPEETARRVVITEGISNDTEVQITSGLVYGDKVITAGSVTDGAKIKIAGTSKKESN